MYRNMCPSTRPHRSAEPPAKPVNQGITNKPAHDGVVLHYEALLGAGGAAYGSAGGAAYGSAGGAADGSAGGAPAAPSCPAGIGAAGMAGAPGATAAAPAAAPAAVAPYAA
eukprot:scaffold873_cov252-Pinguiococcus_pyrenoidosus.AAC.23